VDRDFTSDRRPRTEHEEDKTERHPGTSKSTGSSDFYDKLSDKFVEVEKTGPNVDEKQNN